MKADNFKGMFTIFVLGGVLGLSQQSPVVAEDAAAPLAALTSEENVSVNLLDGKAFVGEIGENGKAAMDKDEFIFQDGKFRSTACDPHGFSGAAYTATNDGDVVKFEAETTSPTDGKIQWTGVVKGNALEGSFLWFKPGSDTPVEHWMKGELKG